jgi:hypothetical protein
MFNESGKNDNNIVNTSKEIKERKKLNTKNETIALLFLRNI